MKTNPVISAFICAIAFLTAGCDTPAPYNSQPATASPPEQHAIAQPTISPVEQAYARACQINTVEAFDKFVTDYPDDSSAAKARASAYTNIDQYSTGQAISYLREHRSSAFQQHIVEVLQAKPDATVFPQESFVVRVFKLDKEDTELNLGNAKFELGTGNNFTQKPDEQGEFYRPQSGNVFVWLFCVFDYYGQGNPPKLTADVVTVSDENGTNCPSKFTADLFTRVFPQNSPVDFDANGGSIYRLVVEAPKGRTDKLIAHTRDKQATVARWQQ